MNNSMLHCTLDDEDGLRLLALSRIPQCSTCPRLAALRANHGERSARTVPDAPPACTYRFCAPLVRRYGQSEVELSLGASSALALTETEIGCIQ